MLVLHVVQTKVVLNNNDLLLSPSSWYLFLWHYEIFFSPPVSAGLRHRAPVVKSCQDELMRDFQATTSTPTFRRVTVVKFEYVTPRLFRNCFLAADGNIAGEVSNHRFRG